MLLRYRLPDTVEMASPSYLEVEVNAERTFVLHKTPLVEHSELLRQLVEEALEAALYPSSPRTTSKFLSLQIDDFPGGSEAFELVARFCYNDACFKITSANVAKLRCAAEFLRMSETISRGNLIRKTEDYLRTLVFWSWEESLIVLRSCEDFSQAAEKTHIIQRCASALSDKTSPTASFAVELTSSPLHPATDAYLTSYLLSTPSGNSSHRSSKAASETWWFDDLATLSVHLMEPVVRYMIVHRAADSRVIAKFLLHYLRSALPVLGYSAASLSPMKLHVEGDEENSFNQSERIQREVVEVVVNLLYNLERKSISCRSLLGLRRIAVALRAGKHCRRDLERMIGRQLDKATLDNILIPALPPRSSSLYDVDLVLRLVEFFLKEKAEALLLTSKFKRSESSESLYSARSDSKFSTLSRTDSRTSVPGAMSPEISKPVHMALLKVGELMDKYLAEIAADTYLKPSKFLALAELLPDYARQSDDGLYRAVDIYLEAHPFVSETDATRLFKVLNYHKLGAETCKSASQNPRFPPSFAIQVALVQQSQLKSTSEGSFRSDRSCSPLKNASRAGQQTVVSLQCSSFEFTLRQEKKKNVKKAQPRAEIEKSCKRSRVDMPGIYRLMQLFHSRSRQH
ncbi:hypothetical protein M758_1G198600 [Ceratodon purpureus]|nr:hypothetical protein M758_1G198600 [Ceratodon purpureus]